jgi:hypothetical protein
LGFREISEKVLINKGISLSLISHGKSMVQIALSWKLTMEIYLWARGRSKESTIDISSNFEISNVD